MGVVDNHSHSPVSSSERFESCPLRSTGVVNFATMYLVNTRIENGNDSPRIGVTDTSEPVLFGAPHLRHLMREVHEVTAVDLWSVLVSAEAALPAEGDLVSEVREFKGASVHAAVPWTRARRVDTPGPSSWSM